MGIGDRDANETGETGSTPALSFSRPGRVNSFNEKLSAWHTYDSFIKWPIVGVFEFVTLIVLVQLMLTVSPLLWLVFAGVLIVPFYPHLMGLYLQKKNLLIALDKFTGKGYAWQQGLKFYLQNLDTLRKLAEQEDASDYVKRVYAEREPIVWAQAIKVARLCQQLAKGGIELTGDAQAILNQRYREFHRERKQLAEIIKACKSVEVLAVSDLELDNTSSTYILEQLQGHITGQLELTESTLS